MICPILIPVTMFRDGKKIFVNVAMIEEIMDGEPIEKDSLEEDGPPYGTYIFIHGRPAIRVKETSEDVRSMAFAATKNFVVETVRMLHGYGYIK